MAHRRGLILCILRAWGVVGVYMGMNVGCSASLGVVLLLLGDAPELLGDVPLHT